MGQDEGARLWRQRQRIRHDIQHQVGLITQLATVVTFEKRLNRDTRERVAQILLQTQWLDQLLGAYHEVCDRDPAAPPACPPPVRTRVDRVAWAVVTAMDLAMDTPITFTAEASWAYTDPLGLWRILRNLVDNAVRVAGPDGRVEVTVTSHAGWTVARVDDNGPGFGAGSSGLASAGLAIVDEFTTRYDGRMELSASPLGGAGVRILLPAAPPPDPTEAWTGTDHYAAVDL